MVHLNSFSPITLTSQKPKAILISLSSLRTLMSCNEVFPFEGDRICMSAFILSLCVMKVFKSEPPALAVLLLTFGRQTPGPATSAARLSKLSIPLNTLLGLSSSKRPPLKHPWPCLRWGAWVTEGMLCECQESIGGAASVFFCFVCLFCLF